MSEVKTNEKPKLNKKSNTKPKREYGYMYIGHLPHGFYEDEIKSYFSQFGKVVRVRLAHSKITGNCKGYGFIQFETKEVAEIAAETMNNYLMFNKLLKCHLIPREKLHPETFKTAKKKFFKPLKCMLRRKFNKKKSPEQLNKMSARQTKKLAKKQEKLKALGINLDLNQMLNPKVEDKKTKKEKSKIVEEKKVEPSQKGIKVEKKTAENEQKNVSKKSTPEQKPKPQIKQEPKKVETPKRKVEQVDSPKAAKQQKSVPTKEPVAKQVTVQKKKNKK